MEIRVDVDDLPDGYSASKIYEDDNCYISIGSGNTYRNNKFIMIIEIKSHDLTIVGGKKLENYCEYNSNEELRTEGFPEWPNLALEYMFKYLVQKGTILEFFMNFVDKIKLNSFEKGKKSQQEVIKEALGL